MRQERMSRTDSGLSSLRQSSSSQLTPGHQLTADNQLSAGGRVPSQTRQKSAAVTSTPVAGGAAVRSAGARAVQREAARLRRRLAQELLRDADQCERVVSAAANCDVTTSTMTSAVDSPSKLPHVAAQPLSSSTSDRMLSCGGESSDSEEGGGGDTARRRPPSPGGISGLSTISSLSMPEMPASPQRVRAGRPKPDLPAEDGAGEARRQGAGDGADQQRRRRSRRRDEPAGGAAEASGGRTGGTGLSDGVGNGSPGTQVFLPSYGAEVSVDMVSQDHRLNLLGRTPALPSDDQSRNYKLLSVTPGLSEPSRRSAEPRRQLLEAVTSALSSQLEDEAEQLRVDHQLQLRQLQLQLSELEDRRQREVAELSKQGAVSEASLRQLSRDLGRQLALRDAQLAELREELRHSRQQHALHKQKTASEQQRRSERERTALTQQHTQRFRAVTEAATSRLQRLEQQHEAVQQQAAVQIKTHQLEVSRLSETLQAERREVALLQRRLDDREADLSRLGHVHAENGQLRLRVEELTSHLSTAPVPPLSTELDRSSDRDPQLRPQKPETDPAEELKNQLTAVQQLATRLRAELQIGAPELQRLQMLQLQLQAAEALQVQEGGANDPASGQGVSSTGGGGVNPAPSTHPVSVVPSPEGTTAEG